MYYHRSALVCNNWLCLELRWASGNTRYTISTITKSSVDKNSCIDSNSHNFASNVCMINLSCWCIKIVICRCKAAATSEAESVTNVPVAGAPVTLCRTEVVGLSTTGIWAPGVVQSVSDNFLDALRACQQWIPQHVWHYSVTSGRQLAMAAMQETLNMRHREHISHLRECDRHKAWL